jgi:hypothetical protein
VRRHEKDTAVILGKEQARLQEEAEAAAAAAERMEEVLAAVGRAQSEPMRCLLAFSSLHCLQMSMPAGLLLRATPASLTASIGRLKIPPYPLPRLAALPGCCSLAELEGAYRELRGAYREEYLMYNLAAAALAQV